jgi:hypothetical protein
MKKYKCNKCGVDACYDGRCGDDPYLVCKCRKGKWIDDGRGGYVDSDAKPIEYNSAENSNNVAGIMSVTDDFKNIVRETLIIAKKKLATKEISRKEFDLKRLEREETKRLVKKQEIEHKALNFVSNLIKKINSSDESKIYIDITVKNAEDLINTKNISNDHDRRIIELCKENEIPITAEYVDCVFTGVDQWTDSYYKLYINLEKI